jgi:hypothetical protein
MTYTHVIPLLLLIACGTEGSRVEASEVFTPPVREEPANLNRDTSAMVLHAFSKSAMEGAPRYVMSAEAVTVISGGEYPENLAQASEPLLLRDGRVVFFLDGALWVLDRQGKLSTRIGRGGAGPGEFRDASVAMGLGDTVLVYDRTLGRISFILPESGVVRSRPFTPSALRRFTEFIGQYDDDALLVGTRGFGVEAPLDRLKGEPWYLARVPPGSDTIQVVDSIFGADFVPRDGRGVLARYARRPVIAAWGSDLLVADGSAWTLERIAASGKVLARYSVPVQPRPVSAAKSDEDTKVWLEIMRARGSRADTTRLFRMIRESPTENFLPVIDMVLVDPDDVAWVKDGGYWYADKRWGWTALHRDGRILGRLIGTGRDPVVAFGTNAVLLRSEDADGFVTFRVHSLSVK